MSEYEHPWTRIIDEAINGDKNFNYGEYDLSEWEWDIRFNVVQECIIEILKPEIESLKKAVIELVEMGEATLEDYDFSKSVHKNQWVHNICRDIKTTLQSETVKEAIKLARGEDE